MIGLFVDQLVVKSVIMAAVFQMETARFSSSSLALSGISSTARSWGGRRAVNVSVTCFHTSRRLVLLTHLMLFSPLLF